MIKDLINIANEARNATLEFLEKDFEHSGDIVKIGAYGTHTSRIDIVAEQEVFKYVQEKDIPINILSEEFGYLERGYSATLVVDPIDGTYNAEHNIPYFSISLAILKKDLLSASEAVLMNMINGKCYFAEKGKGAYFENRKLSVKKKNGDLLFVANIGNQVPDNIYNIIKHGRRVRAMGCASLEMTMVAEGTADLFIYNNFPHPILRIIDIAASSFIVREAGGEVFDDSGEIMNMGFDLKERKNAIAVGNIELLDRFEIFKNMDKVG
jgi:fructose-1,6-bisphosphatase/inositol monophosphatase family enzyme